MLQGGLAFPGPTSLRQAGKADGGHAPSLSNCRDDVRGTADSFDESRRVRHDAEKGVFANDGFREQVTIPGAKDASGIQAL